MISSELLSAPVTPLRGGAGAVALAMAVPLCAGLAGCDPYPDDGEFLAGVVYSANFIAGVRTIAQQPAVGRGVAQLPGPPPYAPYTIVSTTSANVGAQKVTKDAPAASPFWTNGGARQPLDRANAQPVYVFDSSCAPPKDYEYDYRLDLIRKDRQYALFSDIPEVLPTSNGLAGRTSGYSAVVEVIHLKAPGSLPCQSIKRFDTAKSRIGEGGDLQEVRREYRLYQIIDPLAIVPDPPSPQVPLPHRLGFYNQLVVPYIDMGPVPLEADGKTFRTMPVYKVASGGKPVGTVVQGRTEEAGPAYSPICRDYNLTLGMGMTLPLDANDPLFANAMKTENLSSCIVCRTIDAMGNIDCPFDNPVELP